MDPEGAEGFESIVLRDWSTVPRSMLTLAKVISSGANWGDTFAPLCDASALAGIMLCVYIASVQLCILNVLTAAFCQSAIESAKYDADLATQAVLTNKEWYTEQLKKLFVEMDADKGGTITFMEFQSHAEDAQVKAYLELLELDGTDVWTLFKLMDQYKDEVVEADEFIASCLRLKGYAKGADLAKLMYDHTFMANRLDRFMK